jgi:hypothetical protein
MGNFLLLVNPGSHGMSAHFYCADDSRAMLVPKG